MSAPRRKNLPGRGLFYYDVASDSFIAWDGSVVVSSGSIIVSKTNYATILDDTTTTDVVYIGKAAIGSTTASAVWQILKMDISSGMTITWADGNDNFDNVWNNRASLTYS